MMTTHPTETRTILHNALQAIKHGDRVTAQRLAQQAATLAPELEAPWLILAALASPAQGLAYVSKALQLNPESQAARRALDWALNRLPAQPPAAEVEQPSEWVYPPEAEQPSEQVYPAQAEQPTEEVHPPASPASFAEAAPPPLPPVSPAHKLMQMLMAEAEPPSEQIYPAEAELPSEQIHPAEAEQPSEQVSPAQAELPPEQIYPVEAGQPYEQILPAEAEQPSEQIHLAEAEQLTEQVHPPTSPASFAEAAPPPLPPVSPAHKRRWMLMAIAALSLIILAGVIFINTPRLALLFRPPIPTPQCIEPTLTLATIKFRIQSLARPADGSVTVPPAAGEDLAYWVEGTNAAFVFMLGPAAFPRLQNASLKAGDRMTIVWADCGQEDYVVSAVEPGRTDAAALFDQSTPGMRVLAQSSAAGEGLLIRGARPEITPAAVTPEPTAAGAVQAEVSFLDTDLSPDKKNLHLRLSIKNTGSTPISLSASDISLTPGGEGAPLAPLSVDPALPQQIAPGESQTFTIIFPYAGAKSVVFKLLDFSMEFYY